MPRRTGLGKGLEALIPGGEGDQTGNGISSIPIEKITPNPRQPRTAMNQDDLVELSASIHEHGIIQPLIVMSGPQPDQYTLIAGERRWRAARLAGLEYIPAIIRQVSPQQQLELALVENIQRADLSPLETAEAYHQLVEDFGLSHEEIAQKVGKNRTTVTNTLRLLKLPQGVLAALAEGKISEGHARALLALPSTQAQLAVLQTIISQGLNVRQAEELVRKFSGQSSARVARTSPSPEVTDLEERLCHYLGTKVTMRHGKKGGTVIIHYYSDEELDSIISQIFKE